MSSARIAHLEGVLRLETLSDIAGNGCTRLRTIPDLHVGAPTVLQQRHPTREPIRSVGQQDLELIHLPSSSFIFSITTFGSRTQPLVSRGGLLSGGRLIHG